MVNLKENAKLIKKMIPALWIAMKKKETPFLAKCFAILTLGYALSPIDLIPDFIPVLGWILAPSYAVISATLSLYNTKHNK